MINIDIFHVFPCSGRLPPVDFSQCINTWSYMMLSDSRQFRYQFICRLFSRLIGYLFSLKWKKWPSSIYISMILYRSCALLCFQSTERKRIQEITFIETRPGDRGFGASTKLDSDQSESTVKLCKQLLHVVLKLSCCIYYEKTLRCCSQVSQKCQNRWGKKKSCVWTQFLICTVCVFARYDRL